MKFIAPTLAAVLLTASVAGADTVHTGAYAGETAYAGGVNVAASRNVPAELLLFPADRAGMNGGTVVPVTIGETLLVDAADLLSNGERDRQGLNNGDRVATTVFSGTAQPGVNGVAAPVNDYR